MSNDNFELNILCGFRPIAGNFPISARRKGQRLLKSSHILNLRERHCQEQECTVISAKVIPEMKVTKAPYNVHIRIDEARNIKSSYCSCKAGAGGFCKHITAVFLKINTETEVSKTSQPQQWGRPSNSVFQKYSKGKRMLELFPCSGSQSEDFGTNSSSEEALMLYNKYLRNFSSTVCEVLKIENETEDERCVNDVMEETINMIVWEEKVESTNSILESYSTFQEYHSYSLRKTKKQSMVLTKLVNTVPQELMDFYHNNINTKRSEILDIALKTSGQGFGTSSEIWKRERFKRITASIAHRIKTRKSDFESLAFQLANPKVVKTKSIAYGSTTESEARSTYANTMRTPVVEIGLFISPVSPWLGCSPDGLILDNKCVTTLLEIKCPYTLRGQAFVEGCNVYLTYLEYVNGELVLKKSHAYYTQIQLSLYVLNIKKCHLMVYTKLQNKIITVYRDDDFLSHTVTKLQWFYFSYFLPVLKTIFG